MCSQHVSSRASMGEFTYGTLVERLQAHLDESSSTACQPWRAWNVSSGRNRLFQQETCLCVKKRPDRRTVPQSSRILLVKIYIWTVYLTGHSTCKFRPGFCVYGNQIPVMTEITKGRATRVISQTTTEFSRKLPFISPLYCASYMFMFFHFTCPLKLPEIKRLLLIFMHKFCFYSITNFIV